MNAPKTAAQSDDMAPRSAAEDLALIRQMMEAGKRRVAVNGIHFIIWGVVLMTAFFAQYAAIFGYIPPVMAPIWIAAFLIGWTLEYLVARKIGRDTDMDSIPHIAHGSAWSSVGICALVYFGISVAAGTFEPRLISALSAAMIGAAFFITAQVTGVKLLKVPALGWWLVLAYIAYVKSYDAEMLLVMASSCGLLLALPGFLMRRLAPVGA